MSDSDRPLAGQTVVVTRSRAQADKLAGRLEGSGATVLEFPCIDIRTTPGALELKADTFDWVIFSSANAVRALGEKMGRAGLPFSFPGARICAVGPATQDALNSLDIAVVHLVPEIYTAEGAFDALQSQVNTLEGLRVLLPQGDIARPFLREALADAGADVAAPVVYETACPKPDARAADNLVAAQPDWVTFTSGSTARNFAALVGADGLAVLTGHTKYASIGPQTTKEANAAGIDIDVEAEQHDVPGLVDAIMSQVQGAKD